jgi:hypothetical protein
MANPSTSSFSSSLLKKLRRKPNPYTQDDATKTARMNTTTNTNTNTSTDTDSLPDASDTLAEARQAAGRDPVTGKLPPGQTAPTRDPQRYYQSYDQFIEDMIQRRDGQRMEYYAPERRIEEFYAGGARD